MVYSFIMEQKLFFEGTRFAGRTHFSPRLFSDAVHMAASRVEGVECVCASKSFWLAHLFRLLTRRNGTHGGVAIRRVDYTKYNIYVCLSVLQGYSAADIAYRVQEAVLDVACNKNLTDRKVKKVDVTICGVGGRSE